MYRFNDYAVANDIIIVYPDVQYTFKNIFGAWDTYGYSGSNYMTKDSIQAEYLLQVIDQVTSPLDADAYNYEGGNYLAKASW